MQLFAHAIRRECEEMDLDCRGCQSLVGFEEGCSVAGADSEGSAPCQRILQADAGAPENVVILIVEGDGLLAFVDEADLEMILQVFANARRIENDRNAMALEPLGLADA